MSDIWRNSCTNWKEEHLTKAQTALSTYQDAVAGIVQSMKNEVENLVGHEFIGDAANSYKTMHDTVVDNLAGELYGGKDNALINTLNKILNNVETNLRNTMDPNLSTQNKNAVGNMGGNAVT